MSRPEGWRLLVDGVADGPWNMAVDEALLASVIASGAPALRFYRWNGPWLSLGYGQRLDARRLDACAHAGVGVVRRVTGGRAVLHGQDLTYAVVARESALPAGLAATYAFVAGALREALAALGVAAEPAPRVPRVAQGSRFDCFAESAADELCVAGRKLIGSAQRRTGGGVLQHGTIRLAPDPASVRRASGLDTGSATSLEELGAEITAEALVGACRAAFSRRLGGVLEPAELASGELSAARERCIARAGELQVTHESSPQGASRAPLGDR